jgi:hypothetical protein
MATEKDLALVKHIIKLTREGKLQWEATAASGEFTASIKGKYNVSVLRNFSNYEGEDYSLKLVDESERELLRLTNHDYVEIGELFELARRISLNVDEAIDDILKIDADEFPF